MSNWIETTGWTLLHFVWQGAILGLVVAGLLWLCRRRSANTRYAVASGGLVALLAAPVVTVAVLWQAARMVEPLGSGDRTASRALGSASTPGHALISRDSMNALHARVAAALPMVVAIWLTGASLLLVRMGGGLWKVHRLYEGGLAAPASRWQEVAARLASRLGLLDAVRVVESRLVGTPTVVGWMRPIILLPVAALANLTPAQVEAILAHELAHIRRHDYLVNLLQSLGETALFYHPAVWWVSGRIRAEREDCCDDVAILLSGDRVGYASALGALEEWRGREIAPALGATAGPLSGRVQRILGRPSGGRPRSRKRIVAWALALMLGAGVGSAVWPRDGVPSHSTPAAEAQAAQGTQAAGQAGASDRQVSETEHFEIRYGAELAADVDRVEAAAELAYRRVSERLRDELSFSWMDEGLADYAAGTWSNADEDSLRSLVALGDFPALSTAEGRAGFENPRVVYALGHAAFDFVEARWGQAAVSSFMRAFGARGPAANPYEDVLGMTSEAFDAAFADYLRTRFGTTGE